MSNFEHFFKVPHRGLQKAFYAENVSGLTQKCKIFHDGGAGQL